LEALAPVVRQPGGVVSPVNEESPEYCFLSTSPAARDRLLRGLLAEGSGVFLKLSPEDARAVEGASPGHWVVTDVMQRSPYLEIDRDWSRYELSIARSVRQGLSRKSRRLRDLGEVTLELRDGREGLERSLDEGFDLEGSGWKVRQGTAIASRFETRTLYRNLARRAAERSWLHLWFLRLNDAALAFRFDLVVGDVYYHVKGGYDVSHPAARLSPGLLLQHETFKFAFERSLERYEMLGADEPHKMLWTKTCRERFALFAYARDLRGTAGWLGRAVARPAAKRLRSLASRARGS
jgi:CelD/BcsL family acetyltransferase involved in cellulose biosynthesis